MSETEGQRNDSPLLSERGVTTISDTVVSSLAGMAAQEVDGVHMGGGASRAAGGVLGSMTGSESRTSGITVEVGRTEVGHRPQDGHRVQQEHPPDRRGGAAQDHRPPRVDDGAPDQRAERHHHGYNLPGEGSETPPRPSENPRASPTKARKKHRPPHPRRGRRRRTSRPSPPSARPRRPRRRSPRPPAAPRRRTPRRRRPRRRRQRPPVPRRETWSVAGGRGHRWMTRPPEERKRPSWRSALRRKARSRKRARRSSRWSVGGGDRGVGDTSRRCRRHRNPRPRRRG